MDKVSLAFVSLLLVVVLNGQEWDPPTAEFVDDELESERELKRMLVYVTPLMAILRNGQNGSLIETARQGCGCGGGRRSFFVELLAFLSLALLLIFIVSIVTTTTSAGKKKRSVTFGDSLQDIDEDDGNMNVHFCC